MKSTMIFENIIPKINPIGTYMRKFKIFSRRSKIFSSLQVMPKAKNVVNSFCLCFIKEIYVKILRNAVLKTAIAGNTKTFFCLITTTYELYSVDSVKKNITEIISENIYKKY
ncbi:hypothetical protein [Clostridium tagluense]|uniref:hypothetical protein n=1 Tax=Clostridium tagluense TaxID=360422 RepID=UPI00209BAE24|nr:hypothetical protein [Clostridium tagluense]